ncbi:hypothetical protein COLINT_02845 [Collinsella intestinalis DSM 13280]|uniref:Uncharacterized protein n=1 Tax=Collinsella intestinalis DSM 13280 TaxID=521003 RepID=C4F9W1_9ACTN|nr:hypothetical protein COLINT_02845 [Collinsella intestinalis DSM 13280]
MIRRNPCPSPCDVQLGRVQITHATVLARTYTGNRHSSAR